MVPYADLMSVLVILFLALFAYAYVQKPPEFERAVARMKKDLDSSSTAARVQAREADLAVNVKQELDRLALRDFGLRITSRHIHLILPEPVLFSPGSAALHPGAGRVLTPLAKLFAGIPNPIIVQGHTDDSPVVRGRIRNNWELSASRAFSVGAFLMENGLAPERFNARGYGEYRPVASNITAAGRAKNRHRDQH